MYSMVMVVAMTGAPEVPQFGHKSGNGCVGASFSGHKSGSGCVGTSNGCVGGHGGKFFGGNGGCGGKFGGFLGGCFSCFKHKGNGCAGYTAAPVMAAPAQPGCGQTVIPPAPGTVVYPPGTYPPGTVITQPGAAVTPGTTPKAMPKVDPKLGPTPKQ